MSLMGEKIADKIITLMDSKVLLGAAFDCMSERKQEQFKQDVAAIVDLVIPQKT